jgi:hypothetical protein
MQKVLALGLALIAPLVVGCNREESAPTKQIAPAVEKLDQSALGSPASGASGATAAEADSVEEGGADVAGADSEEESEGE